jgi:hypothetical protein
LRAAQRGAAKCEAALRHPLHANAVVEMAKVHKKIPRACISFTYFRTQNPQFEFLLHLPSTQFMI